MTSSGRAATRRASSVSSTIQSEMPSTSAWVSRSSTGASRQARSRVDPEAALRAASAISRSRSVASGRRSRTRSSTRSRSSASRSSRTGRAPALTMAMSSPAEMAWYRNTAWMASRTGSLPRNEKETLETPPLVRTPGSSRLEAPDRLDEGHRVAGVLLDAGADGEDVGVDDDVLGLEAGLAREQADGTLGDGQAPLDRLGLAVLVEGHDHHGGPVAAGQAGLAQELRLSLLERDGVDDGPYPGRPAARPR